MAEQLNTAGATQLAERPAQAGPAASTTTSTTPNTSLDSARASVERASSDSLHGSARASVERARSAGSSDTSHGSVRVSVERAGSAGSSDSSHESAHASVSHGGSGGASSTPVAGTKPIPFAAVSFVCGLVGLLVANLVLGPLAIVLGAMGLRADKNRRVRAVLGILLGVADIAVFVFLAAHSSAHHASLSWNFFSN